MTNKLISSFAMAGGLYDYCCLLFPVIVLQRNMILLVDLWHSSLCIYLDAFFCSIKLLTSVMLPTE